MDARRGEYVRTRSRWSDRCARTALAFALAGAACGSDDETESDQEPVIIGDCPNISGAWTIKVHCNAVLVNAAVTIAQSGCLIDTAGGLDDYSGSVQPDGSFFLRGDLQGRPATCGGVVSGVELAATCNQDCNISLRR